ncbi:hypothetical protein [Dyella sp. ASV21]|uniref:hypothetical protein n=1 Tax=Dyella sp. ASV21 TaxID=2795114 RepID=UPI001E3A31AF|nr:hypothetical protein [Dyella sp. ASV21]
MWPDIAIARRCRVALGVLLLFAGAAAAASTHSATKAHTNPSPATQAGTATAAQGELLPDQRIVVHRNVGDRSPALVTMGIPFAPDTLKDPQLLRILDEKGNEVPSVAKTVLHWYAKDNSIRAVRVQFRAPLTSDEETFYFAIDKPRQQEIAGWPYDTGLVEGEKGLRVPAALATLTPEWLTASLIAGPQAVAAPNEAYANYVATQFKWAGRLPADDSTAFLFDRSSTLFKAYIRTGRLDYLQAADLSYRFYMKYIKRDGMPESPGCAGGWTYNDKPCDVKYVYIEPILLSLALTGDDVTYDSAMVEKMATLWDNGGWNNRPGPYTKPQQYFTERLAGLGLLATVSAYELTGDKRWLAKVNDRVGWLYEHQRNNPDGLGDDGSWRNSWNIHENDDWNPASDVRGASPWMTENIIDGLWHAWLVTGDKRIPGMIAGFGRYLEQYGWISRDLLVNPHDWRNPCSGADGQIAWYWSSSKAKIDALRKIQESEGWYSDAHDVELALPVAAAYYFETDPKQSAALKERFEKLSSSYSPACGKLDDTKRRFNWNNRGSGVVQWLMRQPPGSGASPPASPAAQASP